MKSTIFRGASNIQFFGWNTQITRIMADNRREQLDMMREKMRELKHLKVDIGMEDELIGKWKRH